MTLMTGDDADKDEKTRTVLAACRDCDWAQLRQLASSPAGFVDDQVRRTAWPTLLGCSDQDRLNPSPHLAALDRHREEDQVDLDVNRSFVYYPSDETEKQIDVRKKELSHVITTVLRRHPALSYFQGYHDIVQVLLLVLGADAAVPAVARLSLLRIRDFMLPTMTGALSHLHLLPSILYAEDPVLYKHLSQTQPFFALAATLTLYAHDIQEYGDIARLFDFLLANEAVVSIYLFVVVVISRKEELLDIEADEPEMLHSVLSKLPKPLDLEGLIQRTTFLFERHPPQSLPNRAWSRVSQYSVLKTTRNPQTLSSQTLADGEKLLEQQAAEIRRQETRQRMVERASRLVQQYGRPAAGATLAVVIAIVSVYLNRKGVQPQSLNWAYALQTIRQQTEAVSRLVQRLW
ncbi:hypothetical protein MBLNU230_g5137t1 [Neophaeotheca triangularis]